MTLVLPLSLLDEIRRHAVSTYPEECCGFLIGRAGGDHLVEEIRKARNSAPDSRRTRYSIDAQSIMEAEKRAAASGRVVLGYYHSHPDHPSVPSEFDRAHAWPSYSYLIMSIRMGSPDSSRSWRLDDAGGRFFREEMRIV